MSLTWLGWVCLIVGFIVVSGAAMAAVTGALTYLLTLAARTAPGHRAAVYLGLTEDDDGA